MGKPGAESHVLSELGTRTLQSDSSRTLVSLLPTSKLTSVKISRVRREREEDSRTRKFHNCSSSDADCQSSVITAMSHLEMQVEKLWEGTINGAESLSYIKRLWVTASGIPGI